MTNWRDTYRRPKLWVFDARIAVLILPTLFYLRWWTVSLVVLIALASYIIEWRYNLPPENALRAFRRLLAGPIRPALLPDRRRGLRDYLADPLPLRLPQRVSNRKRANAANVRKTAQDAKEQSTMPA